MSLENKVIKINEYDSVAVALTDIVIGESVLLGNTKEIIAVENIPFGHKVALKNINKGENIIKYGYPIGHAIQDIKQGEHIHTHNLKTNLSGILDYTYDKVDNMVSKYFEDKAFMGYVREDGKVGVRNEVWIVPTVGCVNSTAQTLEKMANEKYGNEIDGIFCCTHNMGCSQLSQDHLRTQKILKGLINNPNAGAVLVLSLGCENNNLQDFSKVLGEVNPERVKFLVTQDVEDEFEAAMDILGELVGYAKKFKRESVSCNNLVLGFKCGGSDGFSGITANSLCGKLNDRVTAIGGSTILTEVPEMFGAETILMNRASCEEVFEKTVTMINDFKNYFTKYNQSIYENPSPGNKKGGISTLEEKSLGCIQKGGMAIVTDVLDFGQSVEKKGLNLLNGPGNDQVSCTNLAASGAQIILFTTGRGNPFGSIVPTVKIASNSNLYKKKRNWIDFNAGAVLEDKSFDELTEEFFDYILEVASGNIKTQNEVNHYRDISIFRDGVIL
ncbi:altronate dehydratase family protein [Niameybacter massiliensis]|uniref:Altronate dehydratase family protein n=1 Tax=Holtiella tumoricola TaxID=3018743 RepID=A0AA42DPE8_9FIRM|nr:altronate dehydratase family protein [Holtiella tumoricola]MDA3732729.1 altronate dehydratase family protein [Holtiella tumoricola]